MRLQPIEAERERSNGVYSVPPQRRNQATSAHRLVTRTLAFFPRTLKTFLALVEGGEGLCIIVRELGDAAFADLLGPVRILQQGPADSDEIEFALVETRFEIV
jgi:hypothetical protein